jgi:DNA-binding NtrC family response regulator
VESELATVLVLDEEADSCSLLKRILQRMGHEVFAFRNIKEALCWADSNVPDLGVVNVRERRDQGFAMFGRLKEANRNLKVMVIADVFSDELTERWFADDFVIKPLDIDQVESKVSKLLEQQL